MTLENISDVPQICSGTLRITPRALNFQNFLGGGPKPPLRRGGHWAPLRTFPLRRLRRLEWRFAPHIVINKISWHPPTQILYPPLSLALYIGMTFASFCDFGTIPFERDLFIRIDTGRAISCFISLISDDDNPSCPELFLR